MEEEKRKTDVTVWWDIHNWYGKSSENEMAGIRGEREEG